MLTLVNSTDEWLCYRPEKTYTTGHLIFVCTDNSNLEYLKDTIRVANEYGRSMISIGIAKDYLLFASLGSIHVSFKYDDTESMCNLIAFAIENNIATIHT